MHSLGSCPACGFAERTHWFRHPGSLYCGSAITAAWATAIRNHAELIEQRYASEYDLAAHFGALQQRKGTLITRRLDNIARTTGRAAIAGCGMRPLGHFAAAPAQRRGWESHGVELNPAPACCARERGVIVHEGRLEDAAPPAAPFDIVTLWDVVEHVPEPARFVTKVASLVAPGGMVYVTTLNRRALVARVFRGRWSMVVEDHFTYRDVGSLKRAFADLGLEPLRCSSFGLGVTSSPGSIGRYRTRGEHQIEGVAASADRCAERRASRTRIRRS